MALSIIGGIKPERIVVPPLADGRYVGYGGISGIITGRYGERGQRAIARSGPSAPDQYRGESHEVELTLGAVEGKTPFHHVLAEAAGITDPFLFGLQYDENSPNRLHMQYSLGGRFNEAGAFVVFHDADPRAPITRELITLLRAAFRSYVHENYPDMRYLDCSVSNDTGEETQVLYDPCRA